MNERVKKKDTGNACKHVGYEEFNPPSWPSACAPEKKDWIYLGLGTCGEEGVSYPEEFWNCADIAITAGEIQMLKSSLPPLPPPAPHGGGGEQVGKGREKGRGY